MDAAHTYTHPEADFASSQPHPRRRRVGYLVAATAVAGLLTGVGVSALANTRSPASTPNALESRDIRSAPVDQARLPVLSPEAVVQWAPPVQPEVFSPEAVLQWAPPVHPEVFSPEAVLQWAPPVHPEVFSAEAVRVWVHPAGLEVFSPEAVREWTPPAR
jgi:hypothetical protein